MYVFKRKWGSPICHVLLTVQNTHRRSLLFMDNMNFLLFSLLFSLLSFFYSGEIFASVWQEEGNFEVLKRCYIQIYPTSFFAVFWKSCQSSTYVKLRVEWCGTLVKEAEEHNLVSDIKRHISKFDTVFLHLNWSILRRKYWSKLPTDLNLLICGPTLKHQTFREFRTPFPRAASAKILAALYTRVSHMMGQFFLKIEKFCHIIGTAPVPEMARAYGLRPRLWLLVQINKLEHFTRRCQNKA